jgi:hypothetical protein
MVWQAEAGPDSLALPREIDSGTGRQVVAYVPWIGGVGAQHGQRLLEADVRTWIEQ